MQLFENQLFDGRYLLVKLIGNGASAVVWKAIDTKAANMVVAIKIYRPEILGAGSAGIAEFQREFTMVYNMTHTNLLHPQGFDICQGAPYLVMAFCENGSATAMDGRLNEQDALKFLRDVAAALEYLHDHNITHQDIKPDNILVDDSCNFMVTDFGISRRGQANDTIGGTRAYMAPEVYRGKPEHSSDIWSLGATVMELINGEPPYGSLGGAQQLQGTQPQALKEGFSPEFRKLVGSMMNVDPRKRPSAAAIRARIDHFRKTGSWNPNAQRNKFAYIAAGILSVLVVASLLFWDTHRTKVRYYHDYVEIWGVPQGVGHISPIEQKHVGHCFKMEYQGGKLRHLSYINSRGNIADPSDHPLYDRITEATFHYTHDGQIDLVKLYNQGGECEIIQDFDENLHTVYFKNGDGSGIEKPILGKTTEDNLVVSKEDRNASIVTRLLLDYDDKGRYSRVRYATFFNKPVTDEDLIHGKMFEYDKHNHVTKLTTIGLDEQPRGNSRGLAIKEIDWAGDNIAEIRYSTVDNQPSDNGSGVPVVRYDYDRYGNLTAEYYFNADGKPALRTDNNMLTHGELHQVNSRGECVKATFVDTEGAPVGVLNGVMALQIDYDDRGYELRRSYLDQNDSLMNAVCEDGSYAVTEYLYNDRGIITDIKIFDKFRQPTETTEGMAHSVFERDSVGRLLSQSVFDKNDKPALYNGYYHKATVEYKNGRPSVTSFFDTDGKPTLCDYGHARQEIVYDELGRQKEMTFYGIDGKPTLCNDHFWKETLHYSNPEDRGNLISSEYFGTDDNPILTSDNYSKVEFIYDPTTNYLRGIRRYGLNHNLISGEDYDYNSRGNVILQKELGENGHLKSGTVVLNNEYDASNRVKRQWFTNEAGQRVIDHSPNIGYCEVHLEYDRNGNQTEKTFWNTDGKSPMAIADGTHKVIQEFNGNHQRILVKYLDINGKPISSKNGIEPEIAVKYDPQGNEKSFAIFDGYGHPIVGFNGYHKIERDFNNRRLVTSERYFGINGQPVADKETGFTRIDAEYSPHGNLLKKTSFKGNEIVQVIYHKYNQRDMLIEYRSVDGKGNTPSDQWTKLTWEYEKDGLTPKKISYYDGNKVAAWQLWNKKTASYGAMQLSPEYTNANHPATNPYNLNNYREFSYWQANMRALAAQCPLTLDDGVEIIRIIIGDDYINVTVKVLYYSNSELTDEQITALRNSAPEIRALLREYLPSNVTIYLSYIDRSNRRLTL